MEDDLPKRPVFRDMRRDDLSTVVRLLSDDILGRNRETTGEEIDPSYTKAFDAIERDPNSRLIVADQDGKVIACMQLTTIPHLTFKGGTRLQIEGVRVDRRYRNRNVGAAMIDWARAFGHANECHLMQLTSNKDRLEALRFYEEQGFQPSHVGFKYYLR